MIPYGQAGYFPQDVPALDSYDSHFKFMLILLFGWLRLIDDSFYHMFQLLE